MNLKRKLIIVLLLIAIIPSSILASINYLQKRELIERQIETINRNTKENIENEVVTFLETNEALLEYIATNDLVETNKSYQINEFLLNFQNAYSAYEFVYVTDTEGNLIASTSDTPVTDYPEYNYSNRQWFKDPMNGNNHISKETYISDLTNSPCLTISVPIIRDGEVVAVLGSDINLVEIQSVIGKAEFGEGGLGYIVDASGKYIAHPNFEDTVLEGKSNIDSKIVKDTLDGKSESLIYTSNTNEKILGEGEFIEKTSWGIVIEQPYNIAFSELRELLVDTGIMLLITIIIVLIIAIVFSKRIAVPIENLTVIIKKLADYDLSFDEKSPAVAYLKRKDEIGIITNALAKMQSNFIDVIKSVSEASQYVSSSSEKLTEMSHKSALASEEVAKTIEEIAGGATEQAKETNEGAEGINNLGNIITSEIELVKMLNDSAKEVNQLKEEGFVVLEELEDKANKNTVAAKEVQEIIIDTNKNADRIESASDMIKGIAEQTNLLALNASIEAARAGEAGRGFAVVAEEIRKLAEETNQFASEISNTIATLSNMTKKGVTTMNEAGKIVASQMISLDDTHNKFEGISNAVENVQQIVQELNHSTENMMNKKIEIINVIENLSAISEENAASTEEASASVEEQTASISQISEASKELSRLAENMQESISIFSV